MDDNSHATDFEALADEALRIDDPVDDPMDDGRDARGRFRRGYSGNYSGRPRKKPPLSERDPLVFANTLVTVETSAGPVQMTRREAVEHRTFQLAMKGGITAIREMRMSFAKLDEMRAIGRMRLDALENEWFFEKRGRDIPFDVQLEIDRLRSALNMGEDPEPAWRRDPEARARMAQILRQIGRSRREAAREAAKTAEQPPSDKSPPD